ncbi:hypothetical protein N825_17245 [Skermanella stibiiresistens SB22]|uniref:Uncharacterized protein n=1 Tax=Skermanella stibiiresistens SB22 TaxID=1385369 RepID=W9GUR5_9PROT|nr:hypothetical protein N825_17245 [Skermanella stibiiresistens SB22]
MVGVALVRARTLKTLSIKSFLIQTAGIDAPLIETAWIDPAVGTAWRRRAGHSGIGVAVEPR